MKDLSFGLALCLLVIFAAPTVFAFQATQPFSADLSMYYPGWDITQKGKFFLSEPNLRVDMGAIDVDGIFPFSTDGWIVIIDASRRVGYRVFPAQKKYMEITPDFYDLMLSESAIKHFRGDPCAGREGATCKKVGTVTIHGRVCDRWDIKLKYSKPSYEATLENADKETQWIDQKLHFVIKKKNAHGVMELTNIKEGPQDPALFQFIGPPGYRKIELDPKLLRGLTKTHTSK